MGSEGFIKRGLRDTRRVMQSSLIAGLVLTVVVELGQSTFVEEEGDRLGIIAVTLISFCVVILVVALFQLVRAPFRQREEARHEIERLSERIDRRPSFSLEVLGLGVTPTENMAAFMNQPMVSSGSLGVTVAGFRLTNKTQHTLQLFFRIHVPFSEGKTEWFWLNGDWRSESSFVDDSSSDIATIVDPKDLRDRYLNSPIHVTGEQTITGTLLFLHRLAGVLGHKFDHERTSQLELTDHFSDSTWLIPIDGNMSISEDDLPKYLVEWVDDSADAR